MAAFFVAKVFSEPSEDRKKFVILNLFQDLIIVPRQCDCDARSLAMTIICFTKTVKHAYVSWIMHGSQKRGFARLDELASLRSCANPLRSTSQ